MPTIDGLLETAIYVDDMERAVRFYQTIFGFAIISTSDRLCSLHITGKQILLIFKRGASTTLVTTAHDGHGSLHLAFAIPATELQAWENWLKQHGIAIEERKTWDRGGVSLYFRDPDQHLLEVATPGVWPGVY